MEMHLLIGLMIVVAEPAPPPTIQTATGGNAAIDLKEDEHHPKLDEAVQLIHGGKPAEALPLIDAVIAAEEARFRNERRMVFSARSMVEGLLYAGMAGSKKKPAIVVDETWSLAYFLKGFALIDLNRGDEAKPYFDKAIALAPMNAQFLAERGEWHKTRRDWASAYADFESAAGAAEFAPDDAKSAEQRRAWRGMAFARIEQGRLADAETLLNKCLKLDGTDAKCRQELDYVKDRRSSGGN
jgi:tetratricopeptide (TPR) repeat protein